MLNPGLLTYPVHTHLGRVSFEEIGSGVDGIEPRRLANGGYVLEKGERPLGENQQSLEESSAQLESSKIRMRWHVQVRNGHAHRSNPKPSTRTPRALAHYPRSVLAPESKPERQGEIWA